MDKYLGIANDFAAWARERYGLRLLAELQPAMVAAFIRERQAEPLPSGGLRSPNTINSYLDALTKLDTALRAVGWRKERAPALVDPALRVPHGAARPAPFPPQEAARILARLEQGSDPRVARVVRAMQLAGLRLDEAVRLRVSEIGEGELVLDGHSTKNGRPRRVPLTSDAARFFGQLRRAAGGRDLVFETARLRNMVQRQVRAAAESLGIADRRAHNFRAHYAEQLYQRLRAKGLTDRQARHQVAAALGHGRTSVLKHYLAREPDGPERAAAVPVRAGEGPWSGREG
jgi:integrase